MIQAQHVKWQQKQLKSMQSDGQGEAYTYLFYIFMVNFHVHHNWEKHIKHFFQCARHLQRDMIIKTIMSTDSFCQGSFGIDAFDALCWQRNQLRCN
jgi:hypothetical protein